MPMENAVSPALYCSTLTVQLSHVPVVSNVTLSIPRGKWVSVVGPNGAGKSTLLKALAGLIPFTGEIQISGQSLATLNRRDRAQQLAWMGQNESLADDLTAFDVVMLGRLPHQSWMATPQTYDHAAVKKAMDATEVWDLRTRAMRDLSGGEKQRVLLSRVLAVEANIVLMDEPLSHLDPHHQADWLQLVQSMAAKGTTVLTVLHDITMALQADLLVVMDKGQLLCHGATCDSSVRQALRRVFHNRITIHAFEGHSIAIHN